MIEEDVEFVADADASRDEAFGKKDAAFSVIEDQTEFQFLFYF